MATIKFWSEMTKATTVDGEDKVMIGRNATGEAMYTDFQYLINQAGMNSSDYIPVDGNTLPDGGEGNKVTFAGPGTYTQSGGDDVVVPENSLGIITWDGDEWVLGSSVTLPTPQDEAVHGAWVSGWFSSGLGRNYEFDENLKISDGEILWENGEYGDITDIVIDSLGRYSELTFNRPEGDSRSITYKITYNSGVLEKTELIYNNY